MGWVCLVFVFDGVDNGLTHDEREVVGKAFYHVDVLLFQFHFSLVVDVAAQLALVDGLSLHVHHVA